MNLNIKIIASKLFEKEILIKVSILISTILGIGGVILYSYEFYQEKKDKIDNDKLPNLKAPQKIEENNFQVQSQHYQQQLEQEHQLNELKKFYEEKAQSQINTYYYLDPNKKIRSSFNKLQLEFIQITFQNDKFSGTPVKLIDKIEVLDFLDDNQERIKRRSLTPFEFAPIDRPFSQIINELERLNRYLANKNLQK